MIGCTEVCDACHILYQEMGVQVPPKLVFFVGDAQATRSSNKPIMIYNTSLRETTGRSGRHIPRPARSPSI